MCLECHRDLTTATELINGAIDRHPKQKTMQELALVSEAVRDTNLLDRHLAGAPFSNPVKGIQTA